MVVLDIGGDVGALVVSVPERYAGAEIEICPAGRRASRPDEGGDWWVGEWRGSHGEGHDHPHNHSHDDSGHHPAGGPAWPHVAVLGRPVGGRLEFGAVYPGLKAGNYDLWFRPDGATALTVTVHGAQVATAGWPETSA